MALTDGLVAKFLLDGDATDSTGTNDGSLQGSPTFVTSGVNHWVEYSGGGSDYISIPYDEALVPTSAITVSTWIKYTDGALANQYDEFFIANGPGTGGSPILSWSIVRVNQAEGPMSWLGGMDNSGKFMFRVHTPNGYVGATDNAVSGVDAYSAGSVETERWYHIVGTYDGENVKIYVDGQFGGQWAQTGLITRSPGSPITMNYYTATGYPSVPGNAALSQDDSRIWNRALSAEEITTLYNETNLYNIDGEDPGGEITMDNVYLKFVGAPIDAFPTEPKFRIFDSAGNEVQGEVAHVGGTGDDLTYLFDATAFPPAAAYTGYFVELYDEYADGSISTPPGAVTLELGYYTAAGSVYTPVDTVAADAGVLSVLETGSGRGQSHPIIEFSWDGTSTPTGSILSQSVFTGPYPAGLTATPMRIRSNAQINHAFTAGGVVYPNVDAMVAASAYSLGSISSNESVGDLQYWKVDHTSVEYAANPTSGMLANFAIVSQVQADLESSLSAIQADVDLNEADGDLADSALTAALATESAARAAGDSSIRVDFAAADSVVTANFEAADSVVRSDFEAADSMIYVNMGLADSALAADFAAADSVVTANFEAADSMIYVNMGLADSVVAADFAAADSVVRSDFEAADSMIYVNMGLADSVVRSDLEAADSMIYVNMGLADSAIYADFGAADSILTADLTAESNARIAGDSTIQADVDANEVTMLAADSVLQVNIDAEETARIAGDSVIQADVDANEVTMLAADSVLQVNIDAEAGLRSTADSVIQADVDANEAARIAADITLQANIDSGDSVLQVNIDAEATARQAGDSVLQVNIDSLSSTVTADMNADHSLIRSELAAEIDGLVDGAPSLLDTLNEIAAAINDDANFATTMATALTNATNDRAAIRSEFSIADAGLKSDLDAQIADEHQHHIDGDSIIQADVDANEVAMNLADSILQVNIDTEISDRQSADSAIYVDFAAADSIVTTNYEAADSLIYVNMGLADSAIYVDFAAADSIVQAGLEAADSMIYVNFAAADSVLRSDLEAADSVVRSDLEAADSLIYVNFGLADSQIVADLTAESNARILADSVLQADIDQNELDSDAADSLLRVDFEAADSVLRVDFEAADSVLTSGLAQEVADRSAADSAATADRAAIRSEFSVSDSSLTVDLAAETAARIAGDSTIQADVDANEVTMLAADSVLTANLASEATARIAGDSTIQADVDANEVTMLAADSALQADIDANEVTMLAGDSVLRLDFEAADSLIYVNMGLADSAIYADFAAADSVVRSDLEAADSMIYVNMGLADSAIYVDFAAADSVVQAGLEAADSMIYVNMGLADSAIYADFGAADSILTADLTAESNARIAGDSVLTSALDVETDARESGDSLLQVNIDSLSSTVTADMNADHSLIRSELAAEIDGLVDGAPSLLDTLNEIAAAINDDPNYATTISTALTNATNDRAAIRSEFSIADASLKSDLDAQIADEHAHHVAGDSVLTSALDVETDAREQGDSLLSVDVSVLAVQLNAGDSALAADLAAESTARQAADSVLRVDFEAADSVMLAGYQAADSAIYVAFGAADSILTADLTAESNARIAGDSTLQAGLDAEQLARADADSVLTSDLSVLRADANADFAQLYDFNRVDSDTQLVTLTTGTTVNFSQDASYVKFVTLNGLILDSSEYTLVLNGGGTAYSGIQFGYDLVAGDTWSVHFNKVVTFSA